jgi:hypothetical protein
VVPESGSELPALIDPILKRFVAYSQGTVMTVQIKPELECRLAAITSDRSVSLEQLVEEAIVTYLNTLESGPSVWVNTTQRALSSVWPAEDFSDWLPPDGQ